MNLVLASGSPRRKELLATAGYSFKVRSVDVDETPFDGESPADYVERLAEAKARAAWHEGEVTLGADTTVVAAGEILGKPVDAADAAAMLSKLSGKTHEVLTGFCFYNGTVARPGIELTHVSFLKMTDAEITDYVASGEPMDKAGAYGIQGLASKFIYRVKGCYFNVVGLPVSRIYAFLRSRSEHGFE
jgi:septum formation protein